MTVGGSTPRLLPDRFVAVLAAAHLVVVDESGDHPVRLEHADAAAVFIRHYADTVPHGTRGAYVDGCRCEACTKANAEYARDWRERRERCRTCGGPAYEPMDYGAGRRAARRCAGCHKIVGRCSCAPAATS